MGKIIGKTKGWIKQVAGAVAGNRDLQREGERDERKAEVAGAVEGVKAAIKDVKVTAKKIAK